MAQKTKTLCEFGGFTLNLTDNVLTRDGEEVRLRPKALAVLACLLEHDGRPVSREEVKTACWPGTFVSDNSVDQEIAEIRRQLGPPGKGLLQNRHGKGWWVAVPVVHKTESSEPREIFSSGGWRSPLPWTTAAAVVVLVLAAASRNPPRAAAPRISSYRQITSDGKPKTGPLVADGEFLYFRSTASRVFRVPVSGGLPAPAPLPGGYLPVEFVRSAGLVTVGPEPRVPVVLWRLDSPHPQPVEVAAGGPGSISPDGRTIAIAQGHALAIRAMGSASPGRVVPVQGDVEWPRWSPDSVVIRFTVADKKADVNTLWEVRRDGTGLHRLLAPGTEPAQACCGAWSRDGAEFVFQDRHPDTDGGALWVVSGGATSGPQIARRLTVAPMVFRFAVPSPVDSRWFVVGAKSRQECTRLDLARGALEPYWQGTDASDIAFSRDGRLAAYCDTRHTVWTGDAQGRGPRRLTPEGLEAYQPHWSPDGTRLAFMGHRPGRPWRIYVVAAAGGPVREAQPGGAQDQGVPSWSPDGSLLVYGDRQNQMKREEMSIHFLDSRTGNVTPLEGSRGLWSPRWSPDDRYIVAQTSDFRSLRLYRSDRRRWTPLASTTQMSDPVWSLDSRYVYFTTMSTGTIVCRVRVPDGKLERLFRTDSENDTLSGVAPDNSPLLMKTISNEDLYALEWTRP